MLQEALATFRRLKSNRLAGVTLGTLAMACEHARDYVGARSMYAEALTTFKAVNDDRDAAVVATHFSWIEFNEGKLDAAVRILGEAISTFRHLNDVPNLVDGHTSMAEYLISVRALRRGPRARPRGGRARSPGTAGDSPSRSAAAPGRRGVLRPRRRVVTGTGLHRRALARIHRCVLRSARIPAKPRTSSSSTTR